MSVLPIEQLYELDAKASVAGFGIARRIITLAAIAVSTTVNADGSLQANGTTPLDKVRIVTQLGYRMAAGAAQTIATYGMEGFILGAGGVNDVIHRFGDSGGVGLQYFADRIPDQLILMPGEYLYLSGYFSGAVAVNGITASAHCIEIPRGNFQF